jgi:hypothetical protein
LRSQGFPGALEHEVALAAVGRERCRMVERNARLAVPTKPE